MSIWIDTNKVSAVLLADGWHKVDKGTFDLDAYEFHDNGHMIHGGGKSGICATGFEFRTRGQPVCGPMTSILAVRMVSGRERKTRGT